MGKVWKIQEKGNENHINTLVKELNIHPVLANLLVQRNITTFSQAKTFFRPNLDDLYDPYLLPDMQQAVDRIEKALLNNEKILVYGDYDVDGTTSVALIYSFFRKRYDNLDYYIPDRYHEGYGVSYKSIDYAAAHGITLIIALDCGIKAVDKVKYATDRGIDFIICDHHTPGETLPDAIAVVDPERPDSAYPFKYLSGCGVGFKLIQAYALKNNIPFDEITKYLDLVAVSIASDIVPLIDENRILAYYGLIRLNENPSVGLKAIINKAGIDKQPITMEDIVFRIGPRINAAGRIESGKKSVDLLISNDRSEAALHCDHIDQYNITRRNIDKNITVEALREMENHIEKKRYSTVLYNPGWHKGVVGIVASRLIETHYRPTIILTKSNGLATGSARSVYGFDLYKAISSCSDLLESFGGHMYAAGLTMKVDNIPKFKEQFEAAVAETITPDMLVPQIEVNAELNLKDITPKFFRILKQFEPFGPENTNPVFFAENVVDNGYGRVVGNTSEHLKLSLIQEEEPYNVFEAIAFNQANMHKKISKGYGFDIAYTLTENNYRGKATVQLNIKDIKTD